jgi:hypothetical protein
VSDAIVASLPAIVVYNEVERADVRKLLRNRLFLTQITTWVERKLANICREPDTPPPRCDEAQHVSGKSLLPSPGDVLDKVTVEYRVPSCR